MSRSGAEELLIQAGLRHYSSPDKSVALWLRPAVKQWMHPQWIDITDQKEIT